MKKYFKIYASVILLFFSIVGFLVKLPRGFQHHDKELHAGFYFFVFIVLASMYPKRPLSIMSFLLLFGLLIEFAQEYSNKIGYRLTGKQIHGRFDMEDVKYNLIGLVFGVFFFYLVNLFVRSKK